MNSQRLEKLRDSGLDSLFEAILTLETLEECYAFFDDLCTVNELKAMAQRFEVARMLVEGETYAAIEEKTGASTATISRVKRSLYYGSDGYALVLRKLKECRGGSPSPKASTSPPPSGEAEAREVPHPRR
ncbi:YerC/YecD family TrpR-related protein [Brockia lithotrophica]|uniref:Trp operon repressor family n=1 Tax=Brockia lithotrophica TaxID=933949 RepID=A0A660L0G3_9BACL|nr:YerC/YecD family TrpR-related protein [Brockia lithotrophica]RKQ84740.1 Trp operon repressor family [Brockia lithotrophica]